MTTTATGSALDTAIRTHALTKHYGRAVRLDYLWMALAAAAVLASATPLFDRRDIAVH